MNKQKARTRRGLKTKALIKQSGKARIVVNRSGRHIHTQILTIGKYGDEVLVACSSIDKELKSNLTDKCKVEQAYLVGKLLGERANEKGITQVAFDRAGYKYHGRVKALAEGAREAGLNF